jgi:hypothetical protein
VLDSNVFRTGKLPEPLINEYSLEEQLQIIKDRKLFYNYVYSLADGSTGYVGKGIGRKATVPTGGG